MRSTSDEEGSAVNIDGWEAMGLVVWIERDRVTKGFEDEWEDREGPAGEMGAGGALTGGRWLSG